VEFAPKEISPPSTTKAPAPASWPELLLLVNSMWLVPSKDIEPPLEE
jgi:hypothetical protein